MVGGSDGIAPEVYGRSPPALAVKSFDVGMPLGVTGCAEEEEAGGFAGVSVVRDLEMFDGGAFLAAIYAKWGGIRSGWAEGGAAPRAWVWIGGQGVLGFVNNVRVVACAAHGTDYGYAEYAAHEVSPFSDVVLRPSEIWMCPG